MKLLDLRLNYMEALFYGITPLIDIILCQLCLFRLGDEKTPLELLLSINGMSIFIDKKKTILFVFSVLYLFFN